MKMKEDFMDGSLNFTPLEVDGGAKVTLP